MLTNNRTRIFVMIATVVTAVMAAVLSLAFEASVCAVMMAGVFYLSMLMDMCVNGELEPVYALTLVKWMSFILMLILFFKVKGFVTKMIKSHPVVERIHWIKKVEMSFNIGASVLLMIGLMFTLSSIQNPIKIFTLFLMGIYFFSLDTKMFWLNRLQKINDRFKEKLLTYNMSEKN